MYQVSNVVNGVPSFLMNDKPLTMSSLQIAEFTGKEHKHIMRDIRDMMEALGGESKTGLSSYISNQNKELPMYELDEEQSICLVSGYDVKMRMTIIKEWKALKEAHDPMAIMGTMNSNQITLFARTAVELAKETKAKEQALIQIEYQKPKVEFFDEVADSSGLMDMGIIAKQLGMGRNKLFELLRSKCVLQKGKFKNNQPYQQYITPGYFVVKLSPTTDGFASQTFVTPKGLTWLHKKVKEWTLN
ncbi:TPA: phage regulatory protein/antirepressor Ant [Aeromonas dhakensis]|uniref:phage antirepressor KilAC domain-containing protein n=1 Tax=Aeromonas dhakensis TaxID=196024 RepID=UPI00288DCDA7|nr:phage regulatory protein/antirepressor Ant [Aeromonas dhakensis]HDX8469033.1 phage regulatory protein/antirepressor Ant [Aeromonas dhakensis]HDZ8869548.1 phage regulatory protein/antirepressor Ant [Aeromonas dhakensis]HDZ8931168.1 phage regulatory protein/antirepressor Ant [Aeromonas dhakensis]HEA3208374.1 phage regulatory protein/antirepressor Ant [Aeromonas dhakensis]